MEHLTQKQFHDYWQSQLQPRELLSVTDHLGECEICRREIQGAMNADAAFFTMRSEIFGDEVIFSARQESAHLTAEQTAEYVDRNLSGEPLQMVDDHLSSCELCSIAVDDLKAFRNEIAPSLDREYRPADVPAPAESWWQRAVTSLPALFRISPVPALGAVLGVLLLAAIGWLILRRQWESSPREEVAVAPASSPSQPSSVQPTPTPTQPEPASLVAQLKDGQGELALDQQGKLSGADDLPPAYQNMLKKALANGRVERSSQLNGLTRPGSSLMSSNGEKRDFSVAEPVGSVLLTNQPTFRWSRLEGAEGYIVEVYSDEFKLVTASPQLTAQSWRPPQPLSRGMVYSWQVKAIKEGQEITSPRPPAPQAKFRVVDQAKVNEISKAKRAYPSSHLTLGLLYAEAGLLKEAEEELRALQRANANSELARNLLRQVQALRRRR